MRSIGLTWTEWKTPWSSASDKDVGTVDQLQTHLANEVLAHENELQLRGLLPSRSTALKSPEDLAAECPAPQMQRKTFKALGTPTVQAAALSADRTQLPAQELQ